MPARTGAQYIAGLQEQAAAIYLHGEKVHDVTTQVRHAAWHMERHASSCRPM